MRTSRRLILSLWLTLCSLPVAGAPRVFPEPREMSAAGPAFAVDGDVPILVPENASGADLRLARLLAAEFSGRHGVAISMESASRLPAGRRFILMGATDNPLVKAWLAAHRLEVSPGNPGPEGYLLSASPDAVVVAGSDERGAFYGMQSLRQLIASEGSAVRIPGVTIRDWPRMPFRGIKIYLPGRDHIGFFKRFVRDYMALYKFNRLILEMNAAMRLDRHPELNAGWLDLARDLQLRRLNEPPALWGHSNNSVHTDTADGGILEKQEVAELVRWAESNYVEVIPELPSLSHSYYLLTRHRELAEIPQEEWPDTYCPSLPAVYKLLFDVYDEYIEVMHPKMIQAGHDEWRMPWGVCPRCRDKDPREVFAEDVNKIHDYLQGKGVRMAIWADYLLENVRGVKFHKRSAGGYEYNIPGALSPEQALKLIPKDILMFNWVWGYTADPKVAPVTNEQRLSAWGFESIYANMFPSLGNFDERIAASAKITGGEPSAWVATTEFNFGKDRIADFAICGEMLWSGRERGEAEQAGVLREWMPSIRSRLSAETAPSATGPVVPIDIRAAFRANAAAIGRPAWKAGRVSRGGLIFELAEASGRAPFAVVAGSRGEGEAPYPLRSEAIPIGRDAAGIVFLHALVKPAASAQSYHRIFAFEDSADLAGWYDIEFEDGLVTTIPLRYGWNILDWKNPRGVLYRADTVDAGGGVRLYAFEWTNTRPGKVIKAIRLNGSDGFRNSSGKVIPSNAIILAAVSVVPKREKEKSPDPPFPK
ncbi:MAG: beta-N-acetylhexosaminidase [Bryobacterales bacterium]|nr:beta-N-acetylhexosaminidase [Bryobacterales bacterium]